MHLPPKEVTDAQRFLEVCPRKNYIEHPLQFSWTFWIYRQQSPIFANNLQHFVTARTGEQFFRVYNYIQSANDMPINMGVYVFKENIRPMWEDAANKNGGRWFFNIRKDEDTEGVWLEMLFTMIGGGFNDKQVNINGAFVLSKNSFNRVGIWIRDAWCQGSCMSIGKAVKNISQLDQIGFETHDSSRKVAYSI